MVLEKELTTAAGGHLSTNRAVHNGDKLFITDILQSASSVKEKNKMENQITEVPFCFVE